MKLPDSWHKSPLGELFKKIVVGYVGNVNDHYCDASRGVPFYRTLNIRDGYFRHDEIRHVTKEFNDKNKKSQIENDDIVIARVGANLGMVCKVSGLNGMANMANAIIIKNKSAKNASSDFYTYFLLSPYGKSQIYAGAAGGAQGVFNTKLTQEISVPVPPLPEQKKIAQILSTWDKAITTTEQLLANSQQQKKALMQQLLTGKKRLLDSNGMRFSGEWKSYHLSHVAVIVMGSSPKSEAYNENGIGLPLLQGNADIKNRISAPRVFTSEITKECEIGDILISVRAPVGTVAISEHKACIGRGIAALHARPNFDQSFIYQFLLWFEPKWGSLSQGSTFESINSDDIKNLKIKVPNFGEQQKIAAVLSTADQEISALQQKLDALKQEKKALMQQLLTGKRRVSVN
ncbi:restriction endonuclease subunit S [Aeromonas media]|uniref:restriction endonuclease subunit S n=1 Tax=Aeromonas media TaxID=651 RepID=UPI0005B2007A|nr:restriction endonuclease subunit S [Aeromonas media]MBS4639973.1 restriction endonuclease subunit S [Aeromonas media]